MTACMKWNAMSQATVSFNHPMTLQTFDRSYIDQPGPMVVFATPGMLHAGTSLYIFKKWANDEKNMVRANIHVHLLLMISLSSFSFFQVIIPGYCVVGTVGHKILNGAKRIEFDKQTVSSDNVRVAFARCFLSLRGTRTNLLILILNMFLNKRVISLSFRNEPNSTFLRKKQCI